MTVSILSGLPEQYAWCWPIVSPLTQDRKALYDEIARCD